MEPLFWRSTGQMPVRNLRRQLQHGQLFWREVGRPGQTVIFLHGSWQDGDQWSDVISLLGQRHHCLAPDLVGFGESERLQDKSAYSIAMQVNVLAELLDSLRLEAVVLVGHSLGAWVAARYALQYPERVKGLCLLEPEGFTYEPKRWRRERWLVSPLAGLWLALTKPFARKSVPAGSPPQQLTWLQNYRFRQMLRRHPAACKLLFQRRRSAMESETIGNQLAVLSLPIVVLQGEKADKAAGRQLIQLLAMAAPEAVVKVLPGSEELPSHEAKAVVDFLKYWLTLV